MVVDTTVCICGLGACLQNGVCVYSCMSVYIFMHGVCQMCVWSPLWLLLLTITIPPPPGAMSSARASPRAPACPPCSAVCVSETWRTSCLPRCSRMGKCFFLLLRGSRSWVGVSSYIMFLAHWVGVIVALCPRCKGHCLHFMKTYEGSQSYFC